MIHHVVMFKFSAPTPALIAEVSALLLGMEGKVPELASIEVGADCVHSERSCDLLLMTHFKSWDDLDRYRVHPRHKEVLAHLAPLMERSSVVDYET